MTIPFVKAQAVGNDFLIVQGEDLEAAGVAVSDFPQLTRAICDRRQGIGADGLEVYSDAAEASGEADASIRLYNSDGSEAELSGNGTRCVAAYMMHERGASGPLRIATGAGVKRLDLVERRGRRFVFDMVMGEPSYNEDDIARDLEVGAETRQVTLVDVGNPQCAVVVRDFAFDWPRLGQRIETLPRFPAGSNVSFVKMIDRHTMEVRFWERGAGETLSSGTGATGAAVAMILEKRAESPVRVVTPAGELRVSWGQQLQLRGAAEIVARGSYWTPDLHDASGRNAHSR